MAEGGNSRNPRKSRYDTLERFHDPIAVSEVIEGPCLLLEKDSNCIDGLAILELVCERVFGQGDTSLLFVVVQCRLEKGVDSRCL